MIIAEIGLNHLGNKTLLNKYTDKLSRTKVDGISIQILTKKQLKSNKLEFCHLQISEIENFINIVKKKNKKVGLAIGDFQIIPKIRNIGKVDFIKVLSKDINNLDSIKKIIEITNKDIYLSTGMTDKKSLLNLLKNLRNYNKKIKLIYTSFKKNFGFSDLRNILNLKFSHKKEVAYGNHSSNVKFIFLSTLLNPDTIFFYVKISDEKKGNFDLPDEFHALELNKINIYIKRINLFLKK